VVTHDLDVAAQANRQIRLKDGKVLADERVGAVAAS
jgi:ABC-type lipoprotein export system ATPase subunit